MCIRSQKRAQKQELLRLFLLFISITWSHQKESCRYLYIFKNFIYFLFIYLFFFFKSCLMLVLGFVNCADIFVCQLIVFCCFYICFQGCSLIHLAKLYHVSSSPTSLLLTIAGYHCQLFVHTCDWLTDLTWLYVYQGGGVCIYIYISIFFLCVCESFCSCRQCRKAPPVHLHHMLLTVDRLL